MSANNLVNTASESIAEHELFGDLLKEDEKQFLLDRGIVRSFSTGQYICRQNERDTSLYIVLLGEVEVCEGEKKNQLVLAHLRKGEIFGEISALFKMPRISSVLAAKPSVVLEISADVFEEILAQNKVLMNAIIQRFGSRLIETALRTIVFLRHMPTESLANLIQEASLVSIIPGNTIIAEGEQGNAMFVVAHGAAKVTHTLNGENLPLAIIGPGDYFGEWSLTSGAPRTATVTALSHIEAIRIERETLLAFIQANPDVRDRLDQIAHNRQHGDMSYLGTDSHTEESIENIQHIIKQSDTD